MSGGSKRKVASNAGLKPTRFSSRMALYYARALFTVNLINLPSVRSSIQRTLLEEILEDEPAYYFPLINIKLICGSARKKYGEPHDKYYTNTHNRERREEFLGWPLAKARKFIPCNLWSLSLFFILFSFSEALFISFCFRI